jgi:hypothetical protein
MRRVIGKAEKRNSESVRVSQIAVPVGDHDAGLDLTEDILRAEQRLHPHLAGRLHRTVRITAVPDR